MAAGVAVRARNTCHLFANGVDEDEEEEEDGCLYQYIW